MAEKKEFLMTQEEYNELVEKLAYLQNEKTREIAEKINVARGYGDLSENAEYDAAKEEQRKNAADIAELEEKIKYADVVSEDDMDSSKVNVGMVVKLLDVALKKEDEFELSGADRVNPLDTVNPKISVSSPIGKAILGKSKGETVEVEAPAGVLKFKIVDVYKSKR